MMPTVSCTFDVKCPFSLPECTSEPEETQQVCRTGWQGIMGDFTLSFFPPVSSTKTTYVSYTNQAIWRGAGGWCSWKNKMTPGRLFWRESSGSDCEQDVQRALNNCRRLVGWWWQTHRWWTVQLLYTGIIGFTTKRCPWTPQQPLQPNHLHPWETGRVTTEEQSSDKEMQREEKKVLGSNIMCWYS